MPDTFFSECAARFLTETAHSAPFFLWVGFYVTHSPFRFPIEFHGRFDPDDFPVPPVGPEDHARLPAVFRGLSDRDKKGILAAYHTSVEYMDRNVGTILDALERSGHTGDTLVVFNSDHGYMLGEHGRFEKHCLHEEATLAALLMRLPGVIEPGRSTDALVEMIDVLPTILELCGAEAPARAQGLSLAHLLRHREGANAHHHRDHVIVEYADNAEAMVRTDRWKLIHSAGNRRRRDGYALDLEHASPLSRSTRLYDLENDPSEHCDIASETRNRAIVDGLLATLADHMAATEGRARMPLTPDARRDPYALLDRCLPPIELRE